MISKQANQLRVGDIIVAPDTSRHTVTRIDHHGLAGAWLTIHTDTGLALNKTPDAARLDSYDVVATCRDFGEQLCGTEQCVCFGRTVTGGW